MTHPNLPVQPHPHSPAHLSRCRVVLICSGPAAIGVLLGLAFLVMHSFSMEAYGREMLAAGIIGLAAGFLAVLPLLVMMRHGMIAIVRLTMLAAALRIMLMLAGLMLAAGSGWNLSVVPLAAWTGACYLALLIAESGATAWVVRQGWSN